MASFQLFCSSKFLTVLPEVLIVIKPVKMLLGFHENRNFVAVFIVDQHWTQSYPPFPSVF